MALMRYLGIDYGTKRVGVALSDEGGSMGFPHAILPNDERLLHTLVALIQKEKVGTVVIGDSRTLAGEKNPVAADAEAFAKMLSKEADVSCVFESEVFTSIEARRGPDGTYLGGTEAIDASAAALILTSYLSRL